MKGFTYYVTNAVITQFAKHFDCNLFAETVAEKIEKNTKDSVSVHEARESGMILRTKRDNSITERDVKSGIVDAMQDLIGNDSDDFEVDIVEKYEFQFDASQIDEDFIDRTMDIKRKGRDIYIEIDI